jgi:malate dehydrogenase
MSRPKVAVIGAGNVGATTAQRIAESGLADVVLTDIVEGMPQGKALDLLEAAPVVGSAATLKGTNDLNDIAGARVVVITAGLPRKPGMTREELLKANANIDGPIADIVARRAPESIVVVVSNPLDIMTQLTMKRTGFEPRRVMGMAGVLDAARFACFIALELGIAPTDVRAMVLGGHGDAMVPLPRFSSVSGIPITELITAGRIKALIERTAKGGGEIVNLLKTGSAY